MKSENKLKMIKHSINVGLKSQSIRLNHPSKIVMHFWTIDGPESQVHAVGDL